MPFGVYRADNRTPQTIATDGFQARVPLDEDTARQLVQRSLVDPRAPLQLPDVRGNAMADYFQRTQANPTLVGLPALYAEIRRETSATTMHVSTSPNVGVGGFEHRNNLYRIDVPNDRLYVWESTSPTRMSATPREISALDQAHPPADPKTGIPSTKPVLLTDTNDLGTARLFAISSPSGDGEIAFLTGVPKEWITQTRSLENNGPWQPMPGMPAQAVGGGTPVATPQPGSAAPTANAPASHSQAASSSSSSTVAPPAHSAPAPTPTQNQTPPPLPPRPVYAHPYAHPAHENYPMYRQALDGLDRLPQTANAPLNERARNAAALTDAAHAATPRLDRIDSVAAGLNGGLFAIQGRENDPTSLRAHFDPQATARNAVAPGNASTQTQTPEPAPAQTSVSALRQMFEQPQDPSGSGPRR